MATSIFREYFKGYEILGELGRGNARVLKARSLHTGELVAIKHFAFNTEPDTLRRFQRESEIMKSIQHDYIVKIIEVHLDAELPYIVMQLVEGGDLRSLLKSYGTLDIATVIRLAHHMTEALEAIHAKAVVHRDVKPENIMYRRLCPSGDIHFLLTDFGIAKLREQSDGITATGSSMLTYDYASPEQFNQSKTVSVPTDYYSLGVVLYECLTGAVPFEFEQDDLLLHINRVIACPLSIPRLPAGRSLPPSLLQLLEGLLAKQSGQRICDPVDVRRLLVLAAMEDQRGLNALTPVERKQTLVYNVAPSEPVLQEILVQPAETLIPLQNRKAKKRDVTFIAFVLLLIGGAIFFSWTTLLKQKMAEQGLLEPKELKPMVKEVNHTPTNDAGIISVAHRDYIPATIQYPESLIPYPASRIPYPESLIPHTVSGISYPASGIPYPDPGISLTNGVFFDDFSDQGDSLWNTGKDENSEYKLVDGKYVMKGLTDSLSYSASIKFNLDILKDFAITANTTHLSDSTGDPFGISFCGDEEQDAYFVFYITSNGFYSIGASIKGEWKVLVDWTESANIRQNAEMNILSIEKQADSLHFLINDRLEKVMPFTGGFGNYFGLRVDGAQTVAFDQFIVKGSQ